MFLFKAPAIYSRYLLLALFILPASGLFAQNWTGSVDSNWNNPSNWTGWPLNGEDILIDPANYSGAAASPVISANSVFSPGGMIVQNGAKLVVKADLTATGRVELFGDGTVLSVKAGTVSASGSGSRGRFMVSDGAEVVQDGGTVKASQRVIVELGGRYVLNNGLVNPAEELAIGDGNASRSSLFDMNGGTLTAPAGIGFENEAGLYYPTFDMSAGTLNTGDLSWLGVAPGSGSARFIMSGGTATVGGSILNDPATTVDLYMNLSGNASLSFNGAAVTLVNSSDSIKLSGNAVLTFNTTATWTNPGVLGSEGGTVVINGNTTLQGSGSFTFGNLVIHAGKTLNQASVPNIFIRNDFTSSGTFVPNLNSVTFSGDVHQHIGGNTSTGFYNLVLDNTSLQGVTLQAAASIKGDLQLNRGRLNTSSAYLLTVEDNAMAGSGSASSFVNGPMRKKGNDAFVFPIGKSGRWRRLAITAPASTATEFVAEYFDHSYSSISPFNSPLKAVTNIEHWKLDGPDATVRVSLHWEDAAASAVYDCSKLAMARWNGSEWIYVPAATSGACSGNDAGLIQSVPSSYGVMTFGFFNRVTARNFTLCHGDSIPVGSNMYDTSGTYVDVLTGSDLADSIVITQLTVLPLLVTSQTVGICYGNVFTIGQNTYDSSGIYSDTLVSVDGCDSIVTTSLTIKGPVNVSVIQNGAVLTADNQSATAYLWVNCSDNYSPVAISRIFTATQNGNYAVIITENGCSDTSACYAVTGLSVAGGPETGFSIFPNPTSGKITVMSPGNTTAKAVVFDTRGRKLMEKDLVHTSSEIDLSAQPAGVYFLEITTSGKVSRLKLIRQ